MRHAKSRRETFCQVLASAVEDASSLGRGSTASTGPGCALDSVQRPPVTQRKGFGAAPQGRLYASRSRSCRDSGADKRAILPHQAAPGAQRHNCPDRRRSRRKWDGKRRTLIRQSSADRVPPVVSKWACGEHQLDPALGVLCLACRGPRGKCTNCSPALASRTAGGEPDGS